MSITPQNFFLYSADLVRNIMVNRGDRQNGETIPTDVHQASQESKFTSHFPIFSSEMLQNQMSSCPNRILIGINRVVRSTFLCRLQ